MAAKAEGVFWLVSVFARFFWVLYPQTGYIHPDEYFQSPEITAGDVFGFKTLRTWEFNEKFPVRSILFPHLTTGIPFKVLQLLHSISGYSPWIVNTWTLAVVPRIVYCSTSLLIDLSAYKISRIVNIDPAPVLFVIGTSYVTLVFNTRPFSNSLESVLFALLLWVLTLHICSTHNACHQNWQSMKRNFGIGILVAAGVWNRPTFLAFAVVPGLSWCYILYKERDTISKKSILTGIAREALVVVLGGLLTSFLFIAVDSVYYGYFSTNKGRLAITPLNFITYNLDSSKIKDHGLHPRFTHFLVNMPLLYGILAVLFFIFLFGLLFKRDFTGFPWQFLMINAKEVKKLIDDKDKQKVPLVQKILVIKVMFMSVIIPVAVLSLIPHQEPRFLTPLLLPLAILFSHLIAGPNQSAFVKVSWLIWNFIGSVTFGILHQGGMYSSLGHLQKSLTASESTSVHLVFSNTYMPPRHLLAWPSCSNDFKNCPIHRKDLSVYDLGGQGRVELVKWLDHLVEIEKKKLCNHTFEIFLVCPSTLQFSHQLFTIEKQFFPHISMENPPDLGFLLRMSNPAATCNMKSGNRYIDDEQYCTKKGNHKDILSFFSSWIDSELSLNIFKLKDINNMNNNINNNNI